MTDPIINHNDMSEYDALRRLAYVVMGDGFHHGKLPHSAIGVYQRADIWDKLQNNGDEWLYATVASEYLYQFALREALDAPMKPIVKRKKVKQAKQPAWYEAVITVS